MSEWLDELNDLHAYTCNNGKKMKKSQMIENYLFLKIFWVTRMKILNIMNCGI
jgi:hypothetical protein